MTTLLSEDTPPPHPTRATDYYEQARGHDNRPDRRRYDRDRDGEEAEARGPKLNWTALALVVTILLWILGGVTGWYGANVQEVRRLSERITTLEGQRTEDVRRMERIERSGERVELKVDRILERVR